MRRRSRAGGEPIKRRRRKALKPTRRVVVASSSSPIGEAEVERLTRELNEAREQQSAMSEVLRVIGRSKFELQSVLQSLAKTAARLCRSDGAVIFQLESGVYRFAAGYSLIPAFLEIERRTVISPGPGTVVGRAAMTRKVARIDDAWTDPVYEKKEDAKVEGNRSMIGVPLMRDGEPVVVIGLGRRRFDPFGEREIELARTFATQAVIAIENTRLLNELRQRTTDLTERTADLTEALEQQTATSDVLSVISSSPGDLEPVFNAILQNAARICGAQNATLWIYENGQVRRAARLSGVVDATVPPRPSARSVVMRAIQTKQILHLEDYRNDQVYRDGDPFATAVVDQLGIRTYAAVPMVKEGEPIGAIAIYRTEVKPFSEKQIQLIDSFAAQAVIAIENTRLLNELRQRTTDLTERTADLAEALEQQTATSDVLKVISSSPGDLQPVFEAMLENAVRICDARFGNIYRCDGDALRVVAAHGTPAAFLADRHGDAIAVPGTSVTARMARTKAVIHVEDLTADQAYADRNPTTVAAVELGGVRTYLAVPMLKDNELIGGFALSRQEVRPFTDKQIALVTSFVNQAVIAIENARLLTDLNELLQQQTGTADVLQAISRSTFNLPTVLNTLVELAARLCRADMAQILLPSKNAHSFYSAASYGHTAEYNEYLRNLTFAPGREGVVGRVLLEHKPVQIVDVLADPDYRLREVQRLGGFRTHLGLPLLREGHPIGILIVSRANVQPFDNKHIELLTTFADQAVIAIENTRLFEAEQQRSRELSESLEQQTATSEVLKVISSSAGDLQPVFASMLENAVRICDATFGNIYRWDGGALHLVAARNTPPAFAAEARRRSQYRPDPKTVTGRMLATKAVVHIADLAAERAYIEERHPAFVAGVELGGVRTILAVPMLKDDKLIGSFTVYRQEVRPFTDKQIALVMSFANQAVIAIENARLLNELRESLQQQTATADVLKVLSSSPGELEPVFRAMLENATRLCEAPFGGLFLRDAGLIRLVASHVPPSAPATIFQPGSQLAVSDNAIHPLVRMIDSKAVLHIADMRTDQSYVERNPRIAAFVDTVGARTVLCVPMLKDNEYVGAFIIFRLEVWPFTDKQIELVQNFAAQAVIAIENARLAQRTSPAH